MGRRNDLAAVQVLQRDTSVLRGHAMAAALKAARPADYVTNDAAREAWYDCCRHVAAVVCNNDFSLLRFYDLCGVPD